MTNDIQQEGQWLQVQEFTEDEMFAALLERDFPREAAILRGSGMDRRSFLKIMGASLTLAGFSLQGCASLRPPNEAIVPYVRQPEEVIPGIPLYFTSTMTMGGFAKGVLIETHEGRPHRVDGNPDHPASLGGADVWVLASILDLYNPDRSLFVRNENVIRNFDEYVTALEEALADVGDGAGLRILTETVTSPTLAAQMEDLLEQYPGAQWVQYEPVSRDSIYMGSQMAFGEDVETVYDFTQADVVLSLDGNFMVDLPGSMRYARDFMGARRIRDDSGSMNRLYAVESTPTVVGAVADHRITLRASEVEGFTRALANELGIDAGDVPEATWPAEWLAAVAADLQSGNGLVVPGLYQTPAVHALAHAINDALGTSAVTYTESVVVNPANQTEALRELVSEMEAGDVEALFILGGNPVYNAPADIPFAAALEQVPFSVQLGLFNNETAQASTWHVPQTHYIEEWSDARAYDGTASVVQPPIGPLYEDVRSAHDMIAMLLGDERTSYEIVRDTWQEEFSGGDFDAFWRETLHSGLVADSAFEAVQPSVSLSDDVNANATTPAEGLEVIFRPSAGIWDGRYAENSFLQEMPNPITKVTWDMVAMVSPATADELGLATQDLIEITLGENTMQAPVYVQEGHPDNTLSVSLGYGRGLGGDVQDGRSFNAYQIRTSEAPWFGGVTINNTNAEYLIARTRADFEVEEFHPVRSATFAAFQGNPEVVHEGEPSGTLPSLLPVDNYEGNAWGMSIDLSACIGCNACMIACQTENNIPTVGKGQIHRGRDMYWIRVDNYREEIGGEMKTHFQPVPCMHCEKAPCEIVCPVQATVHDHEGLNNMVYNRCIGTRYCSANCPYSVRRFNFNDYIDDAPILQEMRNPNVSVRAEGVMEKCTYCIQRIRRARVDSGRENRPIADGEVLAACGAACPTQAIVFGNINDADAQVTQLKMQPHNYGLLEELNVIPRTTYLARILNPSDALSGSEDEEA